jgi:small subunit ribosomal protein S13
MARIAGVDLPKQKRGEIGLTYIYGIGPSTAKYILDKNSIDRNKKVNEWNDDELNLIRTTITEELKVEGQLRSEVQMSIKRLLDIACYRGLRHRKGCPFVVSVPKPTAVPVKGSVKRLPVRRRHLRSNKSFECEL